MRRRFLIVDVFTRRPFYGNPVAVVLDAEGLDPKAMQRIAQWTNLSETTFCLPASIDGADYQLRIFTPRSELPFAGHPTLGSVHALRSVGRLTDRSTAFQECGVGRVPIQRDQDGWTFRLPPSRSSALAPESVVALEQAVGVALSETAPKLIDVGPKWVVARLSSPQQLQGLTPNLDLLARFEHSLGATGVTLFAASQSDSADIEVRSFAPSQGVPEDPVCGSGNGAVAAFRRDVDSVTGLAGYCAAQGRSVGRDGEVRIRYADPDEIWVGGECVVAADGFLNCD
jgi:PhzF family phenazine biosynthesis protein